MPPTGTVELVPTTYDPDRQYAEIGVSAPSEAYLSMQLEAPVPRNRARPKARGRRTNQLPNLEFTISQASDGNWIVDERVTGQFGVGMTPPDAVADLFATLTGFLAALQARRYQLAPHLRTQLEWLEGSNP